MSRLLLFKSSMPLSQKTIVMTQGKKNCIWKTLPGQMFAYALCAVPLVGRRVVAADVCIIVVNFTKLKIGSWVILLSAKRF
jgi:hypothetical protein